MDCVIILPNLLFEENNLLSQHTHVFLIEHPVYFSMYNYNKLKIIMHRSTMKYYCDYIKEKYNCKVTFVNFNDNIKKILNSVQFNDIHMHDPHDHVVKDDLMDIFLKIKKTLHIHESLLFITNNIDLTLYYDQNKNKKIIQNNFYKWQRKRLNIMVTNTQQPLGGKWSFDSENREKFPNNFKDVYTIKINSNDYIKKAIKYVTKYFPNNPGSTNYYLPITHKEAKLHLKKFIEQRLKYFGKYQDGISSTVFLGYHSLLAPLINIGLITPIYLINKTLQYYNKNKNTIKISTVEGFIRQIIGWREYCNFMYTFYWKKMEQGNYFSHKNTIDKELWYYQKGTTGFEIIDKLINKTIKYGYLHHIERLMYIGNYFLLINIKPYDTFEWFQSMFLDSYHVFMYPNVYGMSQFSAGDIMMTDHISVHQIIYTI